MGLLVRGSFVAKRSPVGGLRTWREGPNLPTGDITGNNQIACRVTRVHNRQPPRAKTHAAFIARSEIGSLERRDRFAERFHVAGRSLEISSDDDDAIVVGRRSSKKDSHYGSPCDSTIAALRSPG